MNTNPPTYFYEDDYLPISCYNCDRDCMGVFLDLLREGDTDENN